MGMRKFTGTDAKPKVLTPEQHTAAQRALHGMGKTSARHLTEEQRKRLMVVLDQGT